MKNLEFSLHRTSAMYLSNLLLANINEKEKNKCEIMKYSNLFARLHFWLKLKLWKVCVSVCVWERSFLTHLA